jgi:hypothetical protein
MMMDAEALQISRLQPGDASAIVACFRNVYGDSYANGLFYDPRALAQAMEAGWLKSVGALTADRQVLGHMAMTVHSGAAVVEQGNTVVDPAVRGRGLAWKVGAGLSAWARELDFQGFLHYPTADHHIMQRHSVEAGFEVGLMLGYIPAETDGAVRSVASRRRQAATIVYQPYRTGDAAILYLPEYAADEIREFASATRLPRTWQAPPDAAGGPVEATSERFDRRGLERLRVAKAGDGLDARLAALEENGAPCRQIDFAMSDPGIGIGVGLALDAGFRFCGWLPGFTDTDIFRVQKVDPGQTEFEPDLVNPVARSLLRLILE